MAPALLSNIGIEFDVAASMRDGTRLRANIYRPSGAGPWPVLLSRLPYGKDLGGVVGVLDPVQAARRGYLVVVQDTRGRFRSEGDWEPFVREPEDGFDTIAWAAGLRGSDGQVGMFGWSYFGFTQWSAATLRPPALRAIAPFITWVDPLNGLLFRGGALELGVMGNWHLAQGFDVLVRRHATDPVALSAAVAALGDELDMLGNEGYASLPLAEFAPIRRHPLPPAFFELIERPADRSVLAPFWIARDFDQVTVPSFNIGGWYDIFLADTIAGYLAMRERGVPSRLLIGPWAHATRQNPLGQTNFGVGSMPGFIDRHTDIGSLQLRWFDHWLKGLDTGMLSEPPITLFVMGENRWRSETDWPLARAVPTPFYLRAGGRLATEAPGSDEAADQYVYDPSQPVPTLGGASLLTPDFPPGPFDQRSVEARPDVLMFRSEPLTRDVEVTGPIGVVLWAASSARDTDFVARLVDVAADGTSINLTDGIVRARYRDAHRGEAPTLIEADRPYEYAIDLWATSNLFRAGHRIGVDVTSSSFPRWDRNPNTGHPFGADADLQPARQTIRHDAGHPSRIVLPLVPRP
jgi:putative CocE/NonD family hydrolase